MVEVHCLKCWPFCQVYSFDSNFSPFIMTIVIVYVSVSALLQSVFCLVLSLARRETLTGTFVAL